MVTMLKIIILFILFIITVNAYSAQNPLAEKPNPKDCGHYAYCYFICTMPLAYNMKFNCYQNPKEKDLSANANLCNANASYFCRGQATCASTPDSNPSCAMGPPS